ncbi:MAG: Phosphoenolpyruvate synthase/pyruvate phosphate dikinase [Parcubacteria group bacterium GW2011_GWA2_53_21]|nr:MAG: Phosphoenolpyruvate synthase/pyruvate phosphate dikinase [Parcubacteria group bacterium GW2011_GWA2_53_21]
MIWKIIFFVQKYLDKKLSDKKFVFRLPRLFRKIDEDLLKFCRSLYYRDLAKANKNVLLRLLKKFGVLYQAKFGFYPLPKIFSDALAALLPRKISFKISKEDLSRLIASDTISDYVQDRLALLSISESIKEKALAALMSESNEEIIQQLGRFHPQLYAQIESYAKDFNWVPVNHHVQPLNLDLALNLVREAVKDASAADELTELKKRPRSVIEEKKKLFRKYEFNPSELSFINFFKEINCINESRKAAMSKALLWSYPLFQEIANRVGVDVVSLRQLTSFEMSAVLRTGKVNSRFQNIIKSRLQYYYCLLKGSRLKEGSGEPAKTFVQDLLALQNKPVSEIKGNIAQKGYAKGPARLILMEYQVQNLLPGEILVTSMTDPDMVPAMKRAAAIVTDEGGITCHAAIVSRELGKPCVIGTKIATKVFKDGDMVEVDAERGIVRKMARK